MSPVYANLGGNQVQVYPLLAGAVAPSWSVYAPDGTLLYPAPTLDYALRITSAQQSTNLQYAMSPGSYYCLTHPTDTTYCNFSQGSFFSDFLHSPVAPLILGGVAGVASTFVPALSGAAAASDTAAAGTTAEATAPINVTLDTVSSADAGATSAVLSGPAAALATGGAAIASSTGAATSGITGALADASTSLASGVASVTNGLSGPISGVIADVQSVLSPIADAMNSITSLVRQVNDGLIQPILGPITQTYSTVQHLISGFHQDLTQGLAGIVQIPGQIAGALTGIDASFGRAMQELNTGNAQLVTGQVLPAFRGIGAEPIGTLTDRLTPAPEPLGESPDVVLHDRLTQPIGIEDSKKDFADLKALAESYTGILKPLIQFGMAVIYDLGTIGGLADHLIEKVGQATNLNDPIEPLAEGEIVEAIHRGLVDAATAETEAGRLGIDPERLKIKVDLARYLMPVADAIVGWRRNVIQLDQLKTIAEQNGLDQGQLDALLGITQAIFAPADLNTLRQRGLITDAQWVLGMSAAGFQENQYDASYALAFAPVNAQGVLLAYRRQVAAAAGFMQQSFGQAAPDTVSKSYTAAGAAADQANVDWLNHWQLPDITWWVQAYYRGIRTFTEVQDAARAHGIPDEVIADYLTVLGPQLSPFQLPTIMKTGLISEAKARELMGHLGMLQEDIDLLIEYSKVAGKTTKAAMAGALAGLSVANAGTLYADGVITDVQYQQILVAHGYGAEAASLTVELDKLKMAQAARKANVASIVDQVRVGLLSEADAQSQLFNSGYTQDEVLAAMVQIRKIKIAGNKLPTEAQLNKLAKDGIIDMPTWQTTMGQLGYSPFWVSALEQII